MTGEPGMSEQGLKPSELSRRLCNRAWQWDLWDFARWIGKADVKDPTLDVYIVEKFKAFNKLTHQLADLGHDLIERLAGDEPPACAMPAASPDCPPPYLREHALSDA